MPRFVELLACLTALHLACAPSSKPRLDGPTATATPARPATACESKAERSAQAAHACLTSIPADMPIAADKARPFLAELCAPGERDGRVGCAGCAPELAPESTRSEAFADLYRVLEGSFTGRDRSEALLTFSPCDAEQSAQPLILLRREFDRFRRVDALPAASTGRCAASPPSEGYSRLACAGAVHDGLGATGSMNSWLDVLDLRLRRSLRVVAVQSTRALACGDAKRTQLREFGVVEAGFRDLDGDGRDDLWARALWSSGPEPLGYDAHCRNLLQPPEDWMAVARDVRELSCELPETKCEILEFLARDDLFRPSATTARVLAVLDASTSEAPTSW